MINIYYRISSNSYKKGKLPGCTKELCLKNFLENVYEPSLSYCGVGLPYVNSDINMRIIADNCSSELIGCINATCSPYEKVEVRETSNGNAGSFIYCVEDAISHVATIDAASNVRFGDKEDIVYFVEDDYLHKCHDYENPNHPKLLDTLKEGLSIADYSTLYDHPDKYMSQYEFGEFSKVLKTPSSHWKHSISTTMTFAAKVKTIKEDLEIWKKWTDGTHPRDHSAFEELASKGRNLSVAIPGLAVHTDLTHSEHTYNEHSGSILIDTWAINLVEREILKDMKDPPWHVFEKAETPLNRLMMIEAFAFLNK